MTRGNRHRSHRQQHKQPATDSLDSDDGEAVRYGPDQYREKSEGKRHKEEEFKQEVQKRKAEARELGPGNSGGHHVSYKRKKYEASEDVVVDVTTEFSSGQLPSDRWNGGGGDALSLLDYTRTDSEGEGSDRNNVESEHWVEEKVKRSVKGREMNYDSKNMEAERSDRNNTESELWVHEKVKKCAKGREMNCGGKNREAGGFDRNNMESELWVDEKVKKCAKGREMNYGGKNIEARGSDRNNMENELWVNEKVNKCGKGRELNYGSRIVEHNMEAERSDRKNVESEVWVDEKVKKSAKGREMKHGSKIVYNNREAEGSNRNNMESEVWVNEKVKKPVKGREMNYGSRIIDHNMEADESHRKNLASEHWVDEKLKNSARGREVNYGSKIVDHNMEAKRIDRNSVESEHWDVEKVKKSVKGRKVNYGSRIIDHNREAEGSHRNITESDLWVDEKVQKSDKGREINYENKNIDHNMKAGRSRENKRRESQDFLVEQGSSSKFAEDSPLLEKALSDALRYEKSVYSRTSTKGRSDKVSSRKESRDADDGSLNCRLEMKNVKLPGSESAVARNSGFRKKHKVDRDVSSQDLLPKQDQKITVRHLQDNLRNAGLEKEPENRIKRREEFSDKDRLHADDRYGESRKTHRYDRQRDEKYKHGKTRDDEINVERKNDKRKEEKCKDVKTSDVCMKDDRHQEARPQDQHVSRDYVSEKYDNKYMRDGSRMGEVCHREVKHQESDRESRSFRDDRHSHSSHHIEENQQGRAYENYRESKSVNKTFSAGDSKGFSKGLDEKGYYEKTSAGHYDDANSSRRFHGLDTHREEQRRIKQNDIESEEKRAEEKAHHAKSDTSRRSAEQRRGHSQESFSVFEKKRHEDIAPCGDESPRMSARSSSVHDYKASPLLSHIEKSPKINGGLSGMHRHASRAAYSHDASSQEQPRSGADLLPCSESLETCDNPLLFDESSRTPCTFGSGFKDDSPKEPRRTLSGTVAASSDRHSKGCRMEDISSNKRDSTLPSHKRSQLSYSGSRSSLLPPPPPLRPGVDNPAVLGPLVSGFDESKPIRDRRDSRQNGSRFKRSESMGKQGRGDNWKGLGSWNSQGQAAPNTFASFQHQMVGHPHGAFLNAGQQFPGPAFFGIRPSTDMGAVRFHLHDVADAFTSHSHSFGWQRQTDDVSNPHMHFPHQGWEGHASFEESHTHGRPVRDVINQRNWDRGTDMWKVNSRDIEETWTTQVPRGRAEKFRRERSPTECIEIRRSDDYPPKLITENQSSVVTTDVKKLSKSVREKMSTYLSKVDISARLAGPELYMECSRILGQSNSSNLSIVSAMENWDPVADIDNLGLEADTEAESILISLESCSGLFPSLSGNVFERALAFYKKGVQSTKLEREIDSSYKTTTHDSKLVRVTSAINNLMSPQTEGPYEHKSGTDNQLIVENMHMEVSITTGKDDKICSSEASVNAMLTIPEDSDHLMSTNEIVRDYQSSSFVEEQNTMGTMLPDGSKVDAEKEVIMPQLTIETIHQEASEGVMKTEECGLVVAAGCTSVSSEPSADMVNHETSLTVTGFVGKECKGDADLKMFDCNVDEQACTSYEGQDVVDTVNSSDLVSTTQNDMYGDTRIPQASSGLRIEDYFDSQVGTRNLSLNNLSGDTH